MGEASRVVSRIGEGPIDETRGSFEIATTFIATSTQLRFMRGIAEGTEGLRASCKVEVSGYEWT